MQQKLPSCLILFAWLLLCAFSCSLLPREPWPPEMRPMGGEPLRILVLEREGPVRVEREGAAPLRATYTAQGDDLFEDGKPVAAPVRHVSAGALLALEGQRYRGSLLLSARDGRVRTINHVDLDRYLAGVLGREMPLHWPEAALRAQAIAARTYALSHLRPGEDHDLKADQRSQVYGGFEAETRRSRAVVAATSGLVLRDRRHALLPTFFSSTCGGETHPVQWVLGGPAHPSLQGRACGACGASKFHRWAAEIPLAEAGPMLGLKGPLTALVIRHRPLRNAAGSDHIPLVRDLVAHGTGEVVPPVAGYRARTLLGLRSAMFQAEVVGDTLRVRGRGWGHAVGMCQFGALGLAEKGLAASEILRHYYPGSVVTSY